MLVGGERRERGERDRTVWHARTLFLEAVAEWVPEALESLHEKVLPVYEAAYEATEPDAIRKEAKSPFGEVQEVDQAPEWTRWRWQDGDWRTDKGNWSDELVVLHDRLLAWAEDYNLTEDWELDVALRTLEAWRGDQLHRTSLREFLDHEHARGDSNKALDDLRATVLPAFQAAVEATTSDDHPHPDWLSWSGGSRHWELFDEPYISDSRWPELLDLRTAMVEWSEQYLLPTPAVLDAVFDELRSLAEMTRQLRFRALRFADISDAPRFEFEFQAWTPRWTSRSNYEKELRTEFDIQLQDYLEAQEREAIEQGLERSPEKRGQFGARDDQHFAWLARFQVGKEEIGEIAEDVSRTFRSVQDAIRETADLVDIKRRSLR
jgi:predicted HicB family RNase H-like nuclease